MLCGIESGIDLTYSMTYSIDLSAQLIKCFCWGLQIMTIMLTE